MHHTESRTFRLPPEATVREARDDDSFKRDAPTYTKPGIILPAPRMGMGRPSGV